MDFVKELDLLIRSRYPVIYVRTSEEERTCNIAANIARAQKKNLFQWSSTEGLRMVESFHGGLMPGGDELRQPVAALEAILQDTGRAIYIMKDLHAYIEDRATVRKLRDLYQNLKRAYKTIIILAPVKKIPPDLEKEVYFVNMPLPDVAMLRKLLQDISGTLKQDGRITIDGADTLVNHIADAALGLTLDEAERVFFKAIARDAKLSQEDAQFVRDEKRQVVQKSGLLEYYEAVEDLSNVGGLKMLKAWLRRRARAFEPKARDYGLPAPKGLLLLGVQGCGKTLAAKAVAGSWGLPLLRLDMSRIFGSMIGSSEENMRRGLEMADAVSPCVLWIDEIEKTFSGIESSGMSDAGTTARVFGSFLTWMQDKTGNVFCVATANSVSRVPPELLRKGRFDDIFFVDLPNTDERREILAIHLARRRRKPDAFDLPALIKRSEGFSGAEIEQAILSAMYDAYDENREVSTRDILRVMETSVPLSITMREEIEELRHWAHDRARLAT